MHLGGTAPALIQWRTPLHPAERLREQDCNLIGLRLVHPDPHRVERMLRSISLDAAAVVIESGEQPSLVAQIETPFGIKSLPST